MCTLNRHTLGRSRHRRPVPGLAGGKRAEMIGQMCRPWCVFHIKDHSLGIARPDTSGFGGLISQAHVYTVDAHTCTQDENLRSCLHEETLGLLNPEMCYSGFVNVLQAQSCCLILSAPLRGFFWLAVSQRNMFILSCWASMLPCRLGSLVSEYFLLSSPLVESTEATKQMYTHLYLHLHSLEHICYFTWTRTLT